jgi:TetR/AcrR family transcriptional repressor of nem operon
MAPRRPTETRRKIVDAAFWEIYRNGFQGASIDRILDGTGVTKGALFHHFATKQQLGYAVVDEAVGAWIDGHWIAPLGRHEDPITAIPDQVRAYLDASPEEIIHGGCPLNNLTQEMAGIDEGFRLRLDVIADRWRAAVEAAWERAGHHDLVGPSPTVTEVASFVVSAIEGILGTAKGAKSVALARQSAETFAAVFARLRP